MNKMTFSEGVYIELRGNRRLVAEGIDALLVYEDTKITVGAGKQRISFFGNRLEMRFLSENRIVIEGDLRGLQYEDLPEHEKGAQPRYV